MFEFNILLNTDCKRIPIDTPTSYGMLKEIVREKSGLDEDSDLTINYYQEEEKFVINDDTDYLKFLDFADTVEIKEVDIYLNGKSKDSEELKEDNDSDGFEIVSKRSKVSNLSGNPANNKGKLKQDYCINAEDMEDNDYRNPKFKTDEIGYSKHSYNFSDQKRIYYIKQKKDMQKEEQALREKNKELEETNSISTSNSSNKSKRKKK